jgi:hypothetical protein
MTSNGTMLVHLSVPNPFFAFGLYWMSKRSDSACVVKPGAHLDLSFGSDERNGLQWIWCFRIATHHTNTQDRCHDGISSHWQPYERRTDQRKGVWYVGPSTKCTIMERFSFWLVSGVEMLKRGEIKGSPRRATNLTN